MKKILAIVCLVAFSAAAYADEKPTSFEKLPARAQEFVQKHFNVADVQYVSVDTDFFDKEYKVVLKNGAEIEFYRKGDWKEVDCHHVSVPAEIIPAEIKNYINTNFSGQNVKSINRDTCDYEVELNNHTDLKFNLAGKFIGYDD